MASIGNFQELGRVHISMLTIIGFSNGRMNTVTISVHCNGQARIYGVDASCHKLCTFSPAACQLCRGPALRRCAAVNQNLGVGILPQYVFTCACVWLLPCCKHNENDHRRTISSLSDHRTILYETSF